jgi:hypothetical protein
VSATRLATEPDLAALADLEILRKPYVNAAYATGSRLAGLGTPTSDLDVILVVASDADKDAAVRDGALKRRGRAPIDVDIVTLVEFADAVDSCADFRATWESDRRRCLSRALPLLSKFTAGVHVVKPSAELTELSERVMVNLPALVQLAVVRAATLGYHTNEALFGLALDGDEVAVLRRSHDFLALGLDAWCTSRGSIYADGLYKWVWRRLSRLVRDGPELAALRALYVPETVTVPVPDVARRRVDVAQGLVAQALLGAFATHPLAVPVLPLWAAPPGALWRSPRWMPTRTSYAWGLGEGLRFLEVPVTAIMAWACASGRTSADLAAFVAEEFGVESAGAWSAVQRLLACGALTAGDPAP